MSKTTQDFDKDEERAPHPQVGSEEPVGPSYMERVAILPVAKLMDLLSRIGTEERLNPLSADEFRFVLTSVDSRGWTWTTDDPPALVPKLSEQDRLEFPKDLAEKYPQFPGELAAIMRSLLLGWRARADELGSDDDIAAKSTAVSELLLTQEYRSAFFFDHSTKGPRFHDLDWDVTVKTVERNVKHSPASVYAVLSLETIEKHPRFEEEHAVHCFAADERALRRMIDILNGVLEAVTETQANVRMQRQQVDSGGRNA